MRRPRVGTSTAYIWCCGQGQTPMLLLPQKAEEIRQTYKCTKERILSRCITPWSTQDHKKLLRVVNIAQSITQASPPFHLQFTLLWWNTRIIQTLVCFPSLAFLMKGDGPGPVTVSTNAAWPVELFQHFLFLFQFVYRPAQQEVRIQGLVWDSKKMQVKWTKQINYTVIAWSGTRLTSTSKLFTDGTTCRLIHWHKLQFRPRKEIRLFNHMIRFTGCTNINAKGKLRQARTWDWNSSDCRLSLLILCSSILIDRSATTRIFPL